MQTFKQDFVNRQYMVMPDYEYFHYKDRTNIEVEYHNHDFFEIYFFISGKVTYMIEGRSYKLKPGDIILVNNKELHKPIIDPSEEYERIVLWIKPSFIEREIKNLSDLESEGIKPTQNDYMPEETNLFLCFNDSMKKGHNLLRLDPNSYKNITSILAKFEMACNSICYGTPLLKKIYLFELLVFLNKAYIETIGQTIHNDIESNQKISSIIQHINDNLSNDLSLDTIASQFFISKYHILREFKKYTGFTLHNYILQKRLIFAKTLLKQGLPVGDVYIQCGFTDYHNFIRVFKKAFGEPPKRYSRLM